MDNIPEKMLKGKETSSQTVVSKIPLSAYWGGRSNEKISSESKFMMSVIGEDFLPLRVICDNDFKQHSRIKTDSVEKKKKMEEDEKGKV